MKPNILDRAIMAMAPVHAAKRAAARVALSVIKSGYGSYGANLTKKSMRGWMYHGGSAKEDIEDNIDILRQRSRDAYMGIPTATAALKTMRTNVVAGGLMPAPQLDSDYLGINYDPSHFVWQMMDYIRPIYEFKDKIFHVHYKDIKIFKDKLAACGIMAYPLDYMAPKLPGLGDVRWDQYVSALTDIGYDGYTCIEVEDRSFEGSREKIEKSLLISRNYLKQFVI